MIRRVKKKQQMNKNFLLITILLALVLFPIVGFTDENKEEVNTGQDFTKPLTRFDIRLKYQSAPQDKFAALTTFRVDKPFALDKKFRSDF